MAVTVTLGISTGNSANSATYTSGAFTPAVGDLLVVFASAPAEAATGAVLTGTGAGLTFTSVNSAARNGSVDQSQVWIADVLVSAAASQTVTVNYGADAATGCNLTVVRIGGVANAGIGAVIQSAKTNNGTAGGTPAATFGASPSTANVILGHVGNGANPAAVTEPSTFVETSDNGSATPASGNEVAHKITGFTSTTVTWGSTSATAYCVLILEINGAEPVVAILPKITVVNNAVSHASFW